ncbi:hypothetical protein BaRGS_00035284, partial [Batillaria attramentaria]
MLSFIITDHNLPSVKDKLYYRPPVRFNRRCENAIRRYVTTVSDTGAKLKARSPLLFRSLCGDGMSQQFLAASGCLHTHTLRGLGDAGGRVISIAYVVDSCEVFVRGERTYTCTV